MCCKGHCEPDPKNSQQSTTHGNASNAGVGSGGGVVAVCTCMVGTRGSGVLSCTGDVLEMSVVRGVGGVCDMRMCLARGSVGGEGDECMRKLCLGFTNPVGT